MSENINRTLGKIGRLLEIFEERITKEVSSEKNLPTTTFAKEVCADFDMNWNQVYHIVNVYVNERPDMEIKLGPKGGASFRTMPFVIPEKSEASLEDAIVDMTEESNSGISSNNG
jgi:hypothetical protein